MRKVRALALGAVLALCACSSATPPAAHVPASAAATSSSATDSATGQRLWTAASAAAKAEGGTVLTADAVKSTHATAVKATSGDGVTGDEPVWVIQVKGAAEFTCQTCKRPAGSQAPHGRYFVLILDAATFDQTDFGLDDTATNLAQLGPVIALHA